jgi:hypothetical protein
VAVATRLGQIRRGPLDLLGRWQARWRYAEEGKRDIRLDLLRGYAIFAMVCDHVANISWITPFTGANRFVVSAAEGFVFLAGLVLGMVYGGRVQKEGWLAGAGGVLRRAMILYGVTVGLTLLFVALFRFTELRLWLDRSYGLGLTDPVELLVGTLTLRYTYHGTDILWMYTVLIAAAPLLLLALWYGLTLPVLVGSWAIWLAFQFYPSQPVIPWVATNVNYFPVSAWQVLFVTGLVMGYHNQAIRSVLGRLPERQALAAFAIGLGWLIVVQRAQDTGRLASWPLIGWMAGEGYLLLFEKTSLPIGRLVAFAIVAGFAYSLATVLWVPLRRLLGWLLLPLGTSSLRAYGTHLLVIVLVYNIDALAELYDRSRTANTVLQVVAVGLTFAVVVGWRRLEAGVEWRPVLPSWTDPLWQRHAYVASASVFVLALALAGAVAAGPVRALRSAPADQAAAVDEAGVLHYLPPGIGERDRPTVLLALHSAESTGPDFAAPLIDVARENGWALLAPTLAYDDWSDPDRVATDAANTMPLLAGLIGTLEEQFGIEVQPRVLLFGSGRGALTARQFTILYPRSVAAAATVGPAPCFLPRGAGRAEDDEPPAPLDAEGLAQTAFWIGLADGPDRAVQDCPWGVLEGRPPIERAEVFARSIGRTGAQVQVIQLQPVGPETALRPEAVAFLRARDPKTAP